MALVSLLEAVNGSYLLGLALLVGLVVEGIKLSQCVKPTVLPLVAGMVGIILGSGISWLYQEALWQTCFNGLLAGLLAAGGFDIGQAVGRLVGSSQ